MRVEREADLGNAVCEMINIKFLFVLPSGGFFIHRALEPCGKIVISRERQGVYADLRCDDKFKTRETHAVMGEE